MLEADLIRFGLGPLFLICLGVVLYLRVLHVLGAFRRS